MYHHPDYFDEPDIFKPERYLNNQHGTKKGVNTSGFRDNLQFGAGRVSPIHSCLNVLQMHAYNWFEFILAYLSW
jgi:cytochrome P450